jgi:ABC-type lipoprotein export system ATPase subunit
MLNLELLNFELKKYMIILSNIKKTYQDGENRLNPVLRGINLEVKKGEFVAVKGASGSGKTTLLSILGTLLQPDEGSYLLNGKEMTGKDTDHSMVRNQQIGLVFQDHRLTPQYTVLENILLPALAYASETGKEETEYAHHLMELTHISKLSGQYPDALSGGETSRAAVCRALIMKPLLLLADEPTGQLDAENARNIAMLLSDVNKNLGTTMIMVTHSDETSAVAHRILTLNEGILG